MGKLLISNNDKWFRKLNNMFSSQGFDSTFETKDIAVYSKLYAKNENSLCRGDKAVMCVGSWAYKEEVGRKGLELLFEDAIENGMSIKEIRANIAGTCCCMIKQGEVAHVFVDETHTYAMYYFASENGFIITNTYYHIQKCAERTIDKEMIRLILGITGLSSERTPFTDIKRLMQDEVIEVNFSSGEFSISSISLNDYSYELSSREAVLDVLDTVITKISKALNKNAEKKLIFATGGADSRLKLALEFHNGYTAEDIRLAYWGGR